jgi:putative ABC transport system permease protein
MLWLAFKMLFQERGRLAITLIGILFSTLLTLMLVGIYIGMMGNATGIVRHTDADIWVMSKNVPNFDFSQPFPAYRINRVRALDQVLWAEKLHVWFGFIKLHDGRREQVEVVGFNPDTGIGGPWSMQVGTPAAVKGGRYLILDISSKQRLGDLEIGSLWEINLPPKEQSFKLVGLSQGVVSFTTVPVAFTSYNQIERILADTDVRDDTSFIVAKLKDPGKLQDVVRTLRAELPVNDVYSREGFIRRAVLYWTVQTGMGMAIFFSAILAVLIGGAIVGQTIYAGTMEHLRDYGTLKAMGARNRDINLVILSQAAASAVLGFVLGAGVTLLMRGGAVGAGVPIELPWQLFATLVVTIVLVCLGAAYFSVRKVKTLDPVMVFRE